MRRIRLLFLLLLIASSSLAAVADQTYSLIWKPKQDQSFAYTLSLDTEAQGAKVNFGAELGLKVAKVEANGDYTVEVLFQKPFITVDGVKQEVGDDPSVGKPDIQKFNAKGERLDQAASEDDDGDPFGHIVGQVLDFNPPGRDIKLGDKWTKDVPADEKKKTRPAKLEYTVAGLEKVGSLDTIKVVYTFAETEGDKPVKAEGAYYIDTTDASLVRVEADISNMKFEDGSPVSFAKVKLERK